MAEPVADDRGGLPSGPARRSAIVAVAAVAMLAAALLPFAGRTAPAMPGIVALFVAGLLITELSTSFLLLVRFRAVRSWSLLVLACAYGFSGLMAVPHLLTFPGAVLARQPLIGFSLQSTSWIFLLWISGFALLTLIAVCLEAGLAEHRMAADGVGHAVTAGLGLVAVAVLAIVLVAVALPDRLPQLANGPNFTLLNSLISFLGVILLVAGIAVILLWIDDRNRLFFWLSLALAAMAFANLLASAGGGRFTLGWTIGRLSWLAAAGVLFVYLLLLHARDQRSLTHARELLRDGGPSAAHGGPDEFAVAMLRFVARENVERFRRMLAEPQDEARRQVLRRLLADEQERLDRLAP